MFYSPQKDLFIGVLQAPIRDHLTPSLRGFVIGSQILNLTFDPSFDKKLCILVLNEQCEGTLDIYISKTFSICVHLQKITDTIFGYNGSKPCLTSLAIWVLQWSNFGEKVKIITQVKKRLSHCHFYFCILANFDRKQMLIRNCRFQGFFKSSKNQWFSWKKKWRTSGFTGSYLVFSRF